MTTNFGQRTARRRRTTAMIAIALLVTTAGAGLSGATHVHDEPAAVVGTVPFAGNSYAAWRVHYGGEDVSMMAQVDASIAPDTRSLTFIAWIVPTDTEPTMGYASSITIDMESGDVIRLGSTAAPIEIELTSYPGSPYTRIQAARISSGHGMFEAEDFWVVLMMVQDGGEFSGEFRIRSDHATVLESATGDAFYYRDTDYPAAVNSATNIGEWRMRNIELGVVEKEVTGKLFAQFMHGEPRPPTPIWVDQTDGFWVEGPSVDGPVEGFEQGLAYTMTACHPASPYPHPVCNIGYAVDGPFAGQNGGTFAIGGGDPGTYRFRVDHWNPVHVPQPGLGMRYPFVVLVGADVQL